jgi:magnesium transporter
VSTAAILFEGRTATPAPDWAERADELGDSTLLWVDVEGTANGEAREVAAQLDLTPASAARITADDTEPFFAEFGDYLHLTATAPDGGGDRRLAPIQCLVGENWVVTVHDRPVDALEAVRERVTGSGETGAMGGPVFLATVLEWVIGAYHEAFEELEEELERFDANAMAGEVEDWEDALAHLVTLRRELGRLRRALVSHRMVLVALSHPDLARIADSTSAERFRMLHDRLEQALQAARDSREAILGSFDVLLARTEHQTNEIVKVLTLASVLLLPGALVAGVMGMNFKVGLFEHPSLFWVAVALIVGIAAATIVAARLRRWI